jgi:hypothetical protein
VTSMIGAGDRHGVFSHIMRRAAHPSATTPGRGGKAMSAE